MPFGMPVGAASAYLVLPTGADTSQQQVRWRIELEGLRRDHALLGIDVVGDIVIGRGAGEPGAPDLDLEPYGAFEQGVSRHHAMLRPTRNSLYLIDLNSTNGTWHNALRLGSGFTHALANDDTVALGRLTFTIKIIARPHSEVAEVKDIQLPRSVQPAAAPETPAEPMNPVQNHLPLAGNVELPTPPFGSLLQSSEDTDDSKPEEPRGPAEQP